MNPPAVAAEDKDKGFFKIPEIDYMFIDDVFAKANN